MTFDFHLNGKNNLESVGIVIPCSFIPKIYNPAALEFMLPMFSNPI